VEKSVGIFFASQYKEICYVNFFTVMLWFNADSNWLETPSAIYKRILTDY